MSKRRFRIFRVSQVLRRCSKRVFYTFRQSLRKSVLGSHFLRARHRRRRRLSKSKTVRPTVHQRTLVTGEVMRACFVPFMCSYTRCGASLLSVRHAKWVELPTHKQGVGVCEHAHEETCVLTFDFWGSFQCIFMASLQQSCSIEGLPLPENFFMAVLQTFFCFICTRSRRVFHTTTKVP